MRKRRTIESTVRISRNRCLDTFSNKMSYPFKIDKGNDCTYGNILVYQKRYVNGGFNYRCCTIGKSLLRYGGYQRFILTIDLNPEGGLYNILQAFKARENFVSGYENRNGITTRIVHVMDRFISKTIRNYSGKIYFDPDIAVDTFDQIFDDDNCLYHEEGLINE